MMKTNDGLLIDYEDCFSIADNTSFYPPNIPFTALTLPQFPLVFP